MTSRTAKTVTYKKKRGWGYQIIYSEREATGQKVISTRIQLGR
jgi:hypothetical protein